jgi:hypothetical protein
MLYRYIFTKVFYFSVLEMTSLSNEEILALLEGSDLDFSDNSDEDPDWNLESVTERIGEEHLH